MNTTEELRRSLDERGVEWWEGEDEDTTLWVSGGLTWEYHVAFDGLPAWLGFLSAVEQDVTPAQAIDATVGRGKCRFEIKDNCNDSEGTCCDVWFECSGCHARFDYYADEWLMQENYCPACGMKVEQ